MRCSKCGNNYGCACSLINIAGKYYCKNCAIEMYNEIREKNYKNTAQQQYSVKQVINTDILKNIFNKKPNG